MILRTRRLTLRPLEPGDVADLHAMMSDPQVMAFWDSIEIAEPAATAEILTLQLQEVAAGAAICWTARRDAGEDFVGTCELSDVDMRHRRAEIGFMLARDAWGQGYGFEAAHAVVGHAAMTLGLRRLSARIHLGDHRSVELLARLGFRREGVLRGHVERDGERRDCLIFGLLL
jgi:ribosomal-protein-alanine N-acetyltransferase